MEKHTMDHFRDVWYSKLFDRTTFSTWTTRGSKQFNERLKDLTLKTIKGHRPEPLPEQIHKELERMAANWV